VVHCHLSTAYQIRMLLIYRKGILDSLTDDQKAQPRATLSGKSTKNRLFRAGFYGSQGFPNPVCDQRLPVIAVVSFMLGTVAIVAAQVVADRATRCAAQACADGGTGRAAELVTDQRATG
jgi:hypothetical protein